MAFLNSYAVRGMSLDRSENLIAKIVFAILLVVSLSPLLFVAIPAMVDYPNHLARMYILASAGTPSANPFYQTAWALYPNLAMDLVIPEIAKVTGVENATRLFLLLSELLLGERHHGHRVGGEGAHPALRRCGIDVPVRVAVHLGIPEF